MIVVLDARKMTNKAQTHTYLKEVLGLPDYYGNNLDALHDCLEEMTGLGIIVEHEENAGNYYKYVERVIRDIQGTEKN